MLPAADTPVLPTPRHFLWNICLSLGRTEGLSLLWHGFPAFPGFFKASTRLSPTCPSNSNQALISSKHGVDVIRHVVSLTQGSSMGKSMMKVKELGSHSVRTIMVRTGEVKVTKVCQNRKKFQCKTFLQSYRSPNTILAHWRGTKIKYTLAETWRLDDVIKISIGKD